MRSYQKLQTIHFRIKHVFKNVRLDKMDAEDDILFSGYLLVERKLRKRNHQQQVKEIFK